MSTKQGKITGIFNSLVFHTNSAVDFAFTSISDTVSEVSMTMSVTSRRRRESKFLPLDFNTPFSSCFTKHARLFSKMSSTFCQICLNLAVNSVKNPIFKHQTLIFCQKVDDFRIFCSVSGEE
jgi:hypothetical protein